MNIHTKRKNQPMSDNITKRNRPGARSSYQEDFC